MIVLTRQGTVHHMEEKSHTAPGPAKKWLLTHVAKQAKWASTFNHAMQGDLLSVRMEIADINVHSLVVGEVRRWSVRDEHTQVAICYELEKVQS